MPARDGKQRGAWKCPQNFVIFQFFFSQSFQKIISERQNNSLSRQAWFRRSHNTCWSNWWVRLIILIALANTDDRVKSRPSASPLFIIILYVAHDVLPSICHNCAKRHQFRTKAHVFQRWYYFLVNICFLFQTMMLRGHGQSTIDWDEPYIVLEFIDSQLATSNAWLVVAFDDMNENCVRGGFFFRGWE